MKKKKKGFHPDTILGECVLIGISPEYISIHPTLFLKRSKQKVTFEKTRELILEWFRLNEAFFKKD